MCTAITFKTASHYFGRNLDVERNYGECVTITPRRYCLNFRSVGKIASHYAMIGMASVINNVPLYFDATNEKGLSMAGLSFPENAVYNSPADNKDNISPFEFISWILCQCTSISNAERLLARINLTDIPFSEQLPLTPLHWIIADRERALTVESTDKGLCVFENPIGVLTNNPTFDMQLFNLNNYMMLSNEPPINRFCPELPLKHYSNGLGALGLPGDLSSASRFVKAAFTKANSICGDSECQSISQFFHILNSVAQQRGCVKLPGDCYEYTSYSSCCNTDKGLYYYTTYENSRITCVDMHREKLDGNELAVYPLITEQQIHFVN